MHGRGAHQSRDPASVVLSRGRSLDQHAGQRAFHHGTAGLPRAAHASAYCAMRALSTPAYISSATYGGGGKRAGERRESQNVGESDAAQNLTLPCERLPSHRAQASAQMRECRPYELRRMDDEGYGGGGLLT